jgi:glycosyltransferase involved in cell wall biosynthesis
VEKWIALMGKRNTPTDGVADYCTFLGQALLRRGVELEQARVSWDEEGWNAALEKLNQRAKDWRGRWVFFQHTALAWSRRGFALGALRTVKLLKQRGARVAVVFHEYCAQDEAASVIKPVRAACQNYVVRALHARSALSVFTIPTDNVSWLGKDCGRAISIPIGANISESAIHDLNASPASDGGEKTVAVFCFSPGHNQELEIGDMVHAVRTAEREGQRLHLVILGRGSAEIRTRVDAALAGSGVRVTATGILPAEEIARRLSHADALLFVSGCVAQTRGTALAAVASGIPIVGYAGAAEGSPLAEAGLELAPYRNREALAAALARVLGDANLRNELRGRSASAYRKHFSWDAIADKFAAACGVPTRSEESTGNTRDRSVEATGVA